MQRKGVSRTKKIKSFYELTTYLPLYVWFLYLCSVRAKEKRQSKCFFKWVLKRFGTRSGSYKTPDLKKPSVLWPAFIYFFCEFICTSPLNFVVIIISVVVIATKSYGKKRSIVKTER